MKNEKMRKESDSMGELEVPIKAYYGANTRRAELNFPISKQRFSRSFIKALAQIKLSSAKANKELGVLEENITNAIINASKRVIDGEFDDEFVVESEQSDVLVQQHI